MHELLFLMGLTSPNEWPYLLLSGFIPALAVVSLVGGLWSHYKRINCHVHRCLRIGRFAVGEYKVCHVHHPSDKVTRSGISADDFRAHAGEL